MHLYCFWYCETVIILISDYCGVILLIWVWDQCLHSVQLSSKWASVSVFTVIKPPLKPLHLGKWSFISKCVTNALIATPPLFPAISDAPSNPNAWNYYPNETLYFYSSGTNRLHLHCAYSIGQIIQTKTHTHTHCTRSGDNNGLTNGLLLSTLSATTLPSSPLSLLMVL